MSSGDGWRINGEKWFVTSGDVARVLIVMANAIDGADRLPTLFLVEPGTPGVEFVDSPRFTHNYPHGHPTIRFTDVEVADHAVIGGVGNGETLQRVWFTEERLGIDAKRCDAGDLGAVQRQLEAILPGYEVLDATAHDWLADELSRGTWAIHRPGWYEHHHGAMQSVDGRVVLAGSDIANGWAGFIYGTIESELRAGSHAAAIAG